MLAVDEVVFIISVYVNHSWRLTTSDDKAELHLISDPGRAIQPTDIRVSLYHRLHCLPQLDLNLINEGSFLTTINCIQMSVSCFTVIL